MYWVLLVFLFGITNMCLYEYGNTLYVRRVLLVFGALQLFGAFVVIMRGLW